MATTPHRIDAFTVNSTQKGNDHLATETVLSAEEEVVKAEIYGHTSSLGDS